MDFQAIQRVDRRSWRRYLFYFDLAWFLVFALSLILLIRHAFEAGLAYQEDDFFGSTRLMWNIVADTVFLTASLSWIIYRFFHNQYLVLTRRF